MISDTEKLIAQLYLNQQVIVAEVKALRAQIERHPAIADGWMTATISEIVLKLECIKSAWHLSRLRLNGALRANCVEIEADQQLKTLCERILQALELLNYGRKICRDGLERLLDREFVAQLMALTFGYIEAHYEINSAFEAINEKLLVRYPNEYTPQDSVNRADMKARSYD